MEYYKQYPYKPGQKEKIKKAIPLTKKNRLKVYSTKI